MLYKYQCFMYESSLVKHMYWEKKNGGEESPTSDDDNNSEGGDNLDK